MTDSEAIRPGDESMQKVDNDFARAKNVGSGISVKHIPVADEAVAARGSILMFYVSSV